jgi:hypothetical protein
MHLVGDVWSMCGCAGVRRWAHAPETAVCAPFRQSWPCEQQCLHELLRNRSLLPRGWRQRIATAPMQLFNSP